MSAESGIVGEFIGIKVAIGGSIKRGPNKRGKEDHDYNESIKITGGGLAA